MLVTVRVDCHDSSHEGRPVKVAAFRRHDESDQWAEVGATSRKQAGDDEQRRAGLPVGMSELRRALASKPKTDKPMGWQGVTAAGTPTDQPNAGDHVKYQLRCNLCGLDVQVTEERLWPVLDTLAENGRSVISLRALGARVSM
jgi:hypothetical protein